MEIRVVAVERSDTEKNSIYGSSGIMLDKKYVMVTANVFAAHTNFDLNNNTRFLKPGEIFRSSRFKHITLKIISKNSDDKFELKTGVLWAMFVSDKLKKSTKQTLSDWAVDTTDNVKDLETILSVFFVVKVQSNESTENASDFKALLTRWWNLIRCERVDRKDEIAIESAAFGNRFLLDSYSRGIVSNLVGSDLCLVVSDCCLTPGSEGSPVYKINSNCPFGIVISSSCWWRGDWTGLTLIADVRPVLCELLSFNYVESFENNIIRHPLLDVVDSSLVQIYCGMQWGTGVILSVEQGIVLTNSHVIDSINEINVYWKGHKATAAIIYKTPDFKHFDLAVLRCNVSSLNACNVKPVTYFKSSVSVGDEVYCAGFSLFSKNVSCKPSITKGFVAQSSESMVTTTCCVNSGMSGGPVLNKLGQVIGIIVCNTKCEKVVFPHFNMAIPFATIAPILYNFLKNQDSTLLHELHIKHSTKSQPWTRITSKL